MSCNCQNKSREPQANCIFCTIVAGQSPDTEVLFENSRLMIIKDIRPASDFHYLAIPKEHIANAKCLLANDRQLILEMQQELRNILVKHYSDSNELSFGFHWPPFTSISHLHMHGIAPVSKMRFMSRMVFKPVNWWYCSPEFVLNQLKSNNTCSIHTPEPSAP